jgi:hypothetical protein
MVTHLKSGLMNLRLSSGLKLNERSAAEGLITLFLIGSIGPYRCGIPQQVLCRTTAPQKRCEKPQHKRCVLAQQVMWKTTA